MFTHTQYPIVPPYQEHQVYKCYQSGCSRTHNISLYPPYQEHQVYQCYQSGCSHTHNIPLYPPTRNTRSISLDVHTHTQYPIVHTCQEHQVYKCYQSRCSHTHTQYPIAPPTRNTRSISVRSGPSSVPTITKHTHTYKQGAKLT